MFVNTQVSLTYRINAPITCEYLELALRVAPVTMRHFLLLLVPRMTSPMLSPTVVRITRRVVPDYPRIVTHPVMSEPFPMGR